LEQKCARCLAYRAMIVKAIAGAAIRKRIGDGTKPF
jgi:hypothetical protein